MICRVGCGVFGRLLIKLPRELEVCWLLVIEIDVTESLVNSKIIPVLFLRLKKVYQRIVIPALLIGKFSPLRLRNSFACRVALGESLE
jgi:hypothetical protein